MENINIESSITWAEEYIAWFNANESFDPFATFTNTETKHQQIFGKCVDLLHNIENAIETFRQDRDKIIFS